MPETIKTLQEAVPDPSEGLPEEEGQLPEDPGIGEETDFETEVEAIPVLTVGRERLQFLKESSQIGYYRGRYVVRNAHTGYEHDFYEQANYEWFVENCPWLSFDGEVYIDEDDAAAEARRSPLMADFPSADEEGELFLVWLQGIEDDKWEVFKDAVEGLENYPILDENRASELEMEALDEWMKDEGLRELKKELAKLPAFADSFLQFAISKLTLGRAYELSRDEEWQREMTSVWINMKRVAEDLEEDELFVDEKGNNIRSRLERNFMRYKRYAWKAELGEPFKAAVAKHLGEDMQSLSLLQRLTDDQLFQFFLQLTPDDAFNTGEPAWYEDSMLLVRRPDGREDPHHHDYWTVQLDNTGKWQDAIDVLGMVGAEKLHAFFTGRAAEDPRQMKLPGFESRRAKAANLIENDDELTGDDAELDVYNFVEGGSSPVVAKGPGFVIQEVQSFNDLRSAFDEPERPLHDEDALSYYLRDHALFLVRFSNNERMLIDEDLHRPNIESMRQTDGLSGGELKTFPDVVQALIGHYGKLIDEEPDRAANILMRLGGPDAVQPYEDKIDPGMLSGYAVRAGIFYATHGEMRKAVRMLKNRDLRPVKAGAWVLFGDWEDTAPLFGKARNYDWEANAEKLFSGEAYDWFDGVYSTPADHKDVYPFLLPKHWNMLREALVGRTITNDNGEEIVLTPQMVRDWRERDIEKALDSYDDNPDMEELVEALKRVSHELDRRAMEDATYTGFQNCAAEALESREWRFVNIRGKKGQRRDCLAFFVTYDVLEQRLQKYYEDNGEYWDGSFKDLMIETSEKAFPQEDYYERVTKETGPDLIDDILGELKPVDLPEDPNQSQLALESAEARVNRLLEDTYDRGCLMLNLPKAQADFIQDWGRLHIPDDALYIEDDGYGREKDTHVTVKWGILLSEPNDKLKEIANTTKPFPVRIGRVSLFKNDKYDVVKLDIVSPGLRALNARIRGTIPNEETYPTYKPHCTVAYVKKGSCDKLAGQPVFGVEGSPNSTFYVYDLQYNGPGEDGDKKREHKLYLQGGRMDEAAQPDPFEKLPFPADASRVRKRKRRNSRPRSVCS